MLLLKFNKKNYIFISDLHFFHKNVMKYEPIRMRFTEKDKDFFEDDIVDKVAISNELKNIDENIMNWLSMQLTFLNATDKIETIYFGGDFFFNFNKSKFEKLNYDFSKIESFIKNLPGKKILILGNHDDVKFLDWYEKIFDEIKLYEVFEDEKENNIFIISHYPLGDFQREENIPTTKSEKVLARKDKELFENYYVNRNMNKKIINIHGHTHSKSPTKPLDWVEYINMSIENYLN